MYLVVGLGNPGSEYELTRHNIGFQILDSFAQKNRLKFRASKKDYYYSEGTQDSSDFFLMKPASYMNLSGVPLLEFLQDHPVQTENILLLVDDVNLPVGEIRLRRSGSDGGHNGIKSIIYHLQYDSFPRLRFGIGNNFDKGEMADFVLDRFSKEEEASVSKGIEFATELVQKFISGGFKAMLDFYSARMNQKPPRIDNPHKDEPKNEEKGSKAD